ncbi:Gfo/Idh/MocA family protein [Paenibacillus methanolicus]|uniref:Putative dehydrogenase n=1 Tax=Paenibacillus methanolicus TaxID=582686 RepID=A0A5S5CDF3_9BACL|nr:Gfo/Idh/MocA family oxidoreductase [Paenibacillus methanolicus]TYP76380.1 putative dehydrogenase [Paenibacillus methanolicus]
MTETLRVALLGAGAIADSHLDAIGLAPPFTAVAVADLDETKAQAVATRHGFAAYRDYREMIRHERPDVAVIALPHFLHRDAAVFAAEHGCHLMLEKPMALSVAECDAIIEAGRRADIRILVGHTQHYIAENIEAKRIMDSGELGELVMIHDTRHTHYFQPSRPGWFLERALSGGGILANLGTHSIDKLQWLSGRYVRKLSASASYYGDRGDVEGSGMIYAELEGGIPAAIVQSGYLGAQRNETELIFTRGMLKVATGESLWISRGGGYEEVDVDRSVSPFALQYSDLLAAIKSGGQPSCTPAYARQVIAVLEAVYRSARTGTEQKVGQVEEPSG